MAPTPAVPGCPRLLHGGDYNPDQWPGRPEVIEQDFKLMRAAGVNALSVGIFAWSRLEPEEGRYEFAWLDEILDRVAELGGVVALATPSAARPPWLARRYRETSRVNLMGAREPYAGRHNHCYSSPVYREKVAAINARLAARYAAHPALGLWHISNEYGGECFCEHCLAAWQRWLAARYGTVEALNAAWGAGFWSHRYSDWADVQPCDGALDGEKIDWRRFVTDRTVDFMRHEIAAVRRHDARTPVTTNFMGAFEPLDYRRFVPHLDVVANDWYPSYQVDGDLARQAANQAFVHDLMRGLKGGRSWLLLESTPSVTNWEPTPKLKRPGQHRLESLQALAHGADSVMYFQWRKCAGGTEKFHGAVVDHDGREDTRVIGEVSELGRWMGRLAALVGMESPAPVGLIFDWESRWAFEKAQGLSHAGRYLPVCEQVYRALWRRHIDVDVVGPEAAFDGYRLLLAPRLHMVGPEVARRLRAFVEAGGTLVMSAFSGIVDACGRCHPGGWPGAGLRELFGIRVEAWDMLYPTDAQSLVLDPGVWPGVSGRFDARLHADLVHLEGATAVARWAHDFYAGAPAVTVREVGARGGRAVYVGAGTGDDFAQTLLGGVVEALGIDAPLRARAETGVSIRRRTDGQTTFGFFLNFTRQPRSVTLEAEGWHDAIDGAPVAGAFSLPALGSRVLVRRPASPTPRPPAGSPGP